MARVSRYESLVGQTIKGVYVLNYERVKKVSKTGRKYTVGRLNVCYVNSKETVLNISIDSFNKWSFVKRLNKLTGKQGKQGKQTFELVLSVKARHDNEREHFKQSDDLDAFRGCVTVQEVKETYKRLAKLFHPDHGGSEEQFKKLQLRYEMALVVAETLEGIMAEANEWKQQQQQENEVFTTLKTTYDLKTLKQAYRKASKMFHPDMETGNIEKFKLADTIYKIRKQAITRALDSFDPKTDKEQWFKEDVDMIEKSIKDDENIKY